MIDKVQLADEMLAHFHHHCREWAKDQAVGDDYIPPESFREDSLYDLNERSIEVFDSVYHTGNYLIMVRQATTDELHYFDLLGVVDEDTGKLTYLTACVDTSWSAVWTAEYPTGLIDTSRPYDREGHYINLPQAV